VVVSVASAEKVVDVPTVVANAARIVVVRVKAEEADDN
jgi:hypothetical protein